MNNTFYKWIVFLNGHCVYVLREVRRLCVYVISTDSQLSAVDSLIDSMMLVEEDENGEQKDMFKVHHIPNPAFQRHFQVLQVQCAFHILSSPILSRGRC